MARVFVVCDDRAEFFDHSNHGRADENGEPVDGDCHCRGTDAQLTCAKAGCGFCIAAVSMAARKRKN